jgi:hypothetical protein
MTEERKHAILFAATILSARRILETIDSDKPNMAEEFFIERAVKKAELILEVIDKRWSSSRISCQAVCRKAADASWYLSTALDAVVSFHTQWRQIL